MHLPLLPRANTAQDMHEIAKPEKFLDELGVIKPGVRVADFGCGAGYFAVPIARRIGSEGVLWAIDIMQSALNVVKSKARREGLFNIRYARNDLEQEGGSGLADGAADVVFVGQILYQADEKTAIMKEAFRVLRQAGKLVMLEWLPAGTGKFGPPEAARLAPYAAKRFAQDAGFGFVREIPAGKFHYSFLFEK